MISLDLESYSEVDISKCGLYAYAQHSSTDVLCVVFDGTVWLPGDPLPPNIIEHILDGGEFSAFNAAFERNMWRYVLVPKYGWPDVPLHAWHCTAAQSATMGLPRRLDHCGKFLDLKNRKDDAGHKLMLKLCKPKDGKRPIPTAEQMQQLISYCMSDVSNEKELRNAIPLIPAAERLVWLLDQTINDRGVYVDIDFAQVAQTFWESYLQNINSQCNAICELNATQVGALVYWIGSRGVKCVSLAKDLVKRLLLDNLPPDVRRVLELRLEAGTSAVKKFPRFIECANPDSRVRGLLRYHGASTGRWAGNLIQPQNFPRGILKVSEIPFAQDLVRDNCPSVIASLWGSVGEVCGSLCRSVIRAAPGTRLIAVDYSQVEARGAAWLAGQADLLKLFEQKADVYKAMASKVFGKPVDEIDAKERFLGKEAVLGCSYSMGATKFQATVLKKGTVISTELAQSCVKGYRAANKQIVALWGDLERCFIRAINYQDDTLHGLKFLREDDWLYIVLPSGRRLAYYKPVYAPDGVSITAPTQSGAIIKERIYGGKLAENIVSGICRDLLVCGMFNVEAASYTTVGSVHDELILEVPLGMGSLSEVIALMTKLPTWAKGFPLAAEGWEGDFYRK